MLIRNIEKIQKKIEEACQNVQRDPLTVTVVAVTKSVSSEMAEEVVRAGIEHLAENRVDKMLEKQAALRQYDHIKWHLIGNLQRRKVKEIINHIDYFHALDSLSLASEIQKRAEKEIACFVEVNVSGEDSKHGIKVEETKTFICQLEEFTAIKVVGLMTMAPLVASESELRACFHKLAKLQSEIAAEKYPNAPCSELSMGMSGDYPYAIEEGATFVRIGTAFFQ